MRLRAAIFLILGGLGTWGILHAQKPFLSYESTEEHAEAPLPPDWERQAEWTRGRLKYTSSTWEHPNGQNTGRYGWRTDYPLGDRHTLQGLMRLTRVDAKSVEQVVELDNSSDIFNWPFLYGVEVGHIGKLCR